MHRNSKAIYQRALRAAKRKAWSEFRANATSGDAFKALASFTGKAKSISLPLELSVNGSLISDPIAIADACSDHFFPSGPRSDDSHKAIEELVKTATRCEVPAPPERISDWEFEAAISSLNPKAAPSVDGITGGLLLLSIPLVKTLFLLILNACLSLCFFPDSWKLSMVRVLGKPNKQDYSTLGSFRPISI